MKFTALALIGTFALVTPAMALDFTQPVKTVAGTDFTDNNGRPVELTLDAIVEGALLSEQAASEDQKNKNYWLVLEIHKHMNDFIPTPDQIVQIRKALAATQTTAVYGQAMTILDPTFVPKTLK